MSKVELRLKELGITLPRPPKAVANYLAGVKVGEILYVAGTVGTVVNEKDEDVLTIRGKLGRELTV
jgi:enamine deaminase RidA (YjgF/YER057c/UK114 family)